MYLGILPTCMPVHHMHAVPTQARRGGIRSSGTGVNDSCEPPCEYWEQNLSLLKKQPMLEITDSSLQPHPSFF